MQIERKLDIVAYKRLSFLFDDGEFTEINSFTKEKDRLIDNWNRTGKFSG